ncbi:glycosyl transferase, partial [Enterococcus faecium]|nr:glycosyl transferase [Enterococcus faecium]
MIPKKIHYCWFGRNPLPNEVKKCIESWKLFCPDYEIIEWNEENYDVFKIDYMAEAYKAEKYAFVSDYARLD